MSKTKKEQVDIEAVSDQIARYFFELWQNRRSKLSVRATPMGSGEADRRE